MITKERLEELIEQGATIYVICWGRVKELNLNDVEHMEEENGDIYYEIADEPRTTDLSHLFETKEDAEWHKEFGCIERTERLVLPTWEEIKVDFVDNKKGCGSYPIVEKNDISIYIQVYLKGFVHIVLFGDTQYNWEITKENYTLACRKAKELFLGE